MANEWDYIKPRVEQLVAVERAIAKSGTYTQCKTNDPVLRLECQEEIRRDAGRFMVGDDDAKPNKS